MDDWNNLSAEAQEWEIAAHEYDIDNKSKFIESLLSKLPKNDDGVITTPDAWAMLRLAEMDLY